MARSLAEIASFLSRRYSDSVKDRNILSKGLRRRIKFRWCYLMASLAHGISGLIIVLFVDPFCDKIACLFQVFD